MAGLFFYQQSKKGIPIPTDSWLFWHAADYQVTLNGGNVSNIVDRTGNGWDISQSDVSLQAPLAPAYVNGHDAVYFAGGKHLSNLLFNAYSDLTSFTIHFCGRSNNVNDSVFYGFGSNWLQRGIYTYAQQYVYVTLSGSPLQFLVNNYYQNWHIYTIRYSTSTSKVELLVDGTSKGTITQTLSALANGMFLGHHTFSFVGHWSEWVGYKKYQDNGEVATTVNYLKTKYGII